MKRLREGELEFSFPAGTGAKRFDAPGRKWPQGISPVDFVLEGPSATTLIEVKDPSASGVPENERKKYRRRLETRELTHRELVPKARGTYSFLHLMERDRQPMDFVVVLGTEELSVQPALLMNLTDRLRQRLAQEAEQPWRREYIRHCAVVAPEDLAKALPGCAVRRVGP